MRLNAQTSWDALCSLSRARNNWHEESEQVVHDRVYLSPDSFGGRNVVLLHGGDWWRSSLAHQVGDESPNVWLGFSESDVLEVEWFSATSGAVIRSRQGGAGWSLEFVSTSDEYRDCESWYLVDFIRAARKGSVSVVEGGDDRAFARAARCMDEETIAAQGLDRETVDALLVAIRA